MKSPNPALAAHLAQDVTTVTTCWKLTLQDNTVMGFTAHDRDLTVSNVLYKAALGYSPSSLQSQEGLSVDNIDLEGIISSDGFSESDLLTGKLDYAKVEIFLVNYDDLTQGTLSLKEGRLSRVALSNGRFTAELRGLADPLNNTIGSRYSLNCRAQLGDTKCKVALGPLTVTGAVTSVSNARRTFTDSSKAQAAGYFTNGLLVWTSGANSGLQMEVKSFSSGGVFGLILDMPYDIAVADSFTVYPGCNKLFSTCLSKFNNVVNFRGEPHLPGIDAVTRGV